MRVGRWGGAGGGVGGGGEVGGAGVGGCRLWGWRVGKCLGLGSRVCVGRSGVRAHPRRRGVRVGRRGGRRPRAEGGEGRADGDVGARRQRARRVLRLLGERNLGKSRTRRAGCAKGRRSHTLWPRGGGKRVRAEVVLALEERCA
eukprot:6214458-Pleurochrysis_carterae.AAC.7